MHLTWSASLGGAEASCLVLLQMEQIFICLWWPSEPSTPQRCPHVSAGFTFKAVVLGPLTHLKEALQSTAGRVVMEVLAKK